MTDRDDQPLQMPARWWSIQWVSIRIVWGFIGGGAFARVAGDNTNEGAVGGLIICVVVFAALTVIAYADRRRWAREHS